MIRTVGTREWDGERLRDRGKRMRGKESNTDERKRW
jgi:hypothetical protein